MTIDLHVFADPASITALAHLLQAVVPVVMLTITVKIFR